MTITERDLINAALILESEPCHCGAVPAITYEPGVTEIRCPKGCLWFTAPDFEIAAAIEGWRGITS